MVRALPPWAVVCYNVRMPIHLLPPEVASKIAAGEVVERPANVIKELVENAIDAGATEIRVEVREGGRRLMRITDNGHGIPAQEAPLAFERHATSKLSGVDDLDHIATFGFRGEALYSIAAVSQLTLTTRHTAEDFAVTLRVEGGNLVNQSRRGAVRHCGERGEPLLQYAGAAEIPSATRHRSRTDCAGH
ncbi:MAG: ATP-binding protein [Anaerolineales bacterium]|nr:ATP-binding protein [Anaerolineales bacterium]